VNTAVKFAVFHDLQTGFKDPMSSTTTCLIPARRRFTRCKPARADRPEACPSLTKWLRHSPSGDLFGLTQNAGMGWNPAEGGAQTISQSQYARRIACARWQAIALGDHTGHWEIGLLVQAAAEEFRRLTTIPFAGFCSEPCDGRTQGTTGMFDSLPYRTMRR